MNTDRKNNVRSFPVPLELMMDVLKIILTNDLPNQIIGLNIMGNAVWLKVQFPAGHPYSEDARKNIETLLSDYGYFTGCAPDQTLSTEQNF